MERLLNNRLLDFARAGRGAGFLIGGSGLGKSTALRALGEQWLTDGGTTLLVPHELVEQAAGIEQAIALALRTLGARSPPRLAAPRRLRLQRRTSRCCSLSRT